MIETAVTCASTASSDPELLPVAARHQCVVRERESNSDSFEPLRAIAPRSGSRDTASAGGRSDTRFPVKCQRDPSIASFAIVAVAKGEIWPRYDPEPMWRTNATGEVVADF